MVFQNSLQNIFKNYVFTPVAKATSIKYFQKWCIHFILKSEMSVRIILSSGSMDVLCLYQALQEQLKVRTEKMIVTPHSNSEGEAKCSADNICAWDRNYDRQGL